MDLIIPSTNVIEILGCFFNEYLKVSGIKKLHPYIQTSNFDERGGVNIGRSYVDWQ